MNRSAFLILTLAILSALPGRAEETDEFTPIGKVPANAASAINESVNSQLLEVTTKLNNSLSSFNCQTDKKKIIKAVLYVMDSNFTSVGKVLRRQKRKNEGFSFRSTHTADEFGLPESLDSVETAGVTDQRDSIYDGIWSIGGCCLKRINLNGVLVGIDKIDHFLGKGAQLWAIHEKSQSSDKPMTEKDILTLSTATEHAGWGLLFNGIKSYGDLSANYAGFRFYQSILDGPEPYLKCSGNKLKVVRKFDISDYVDEAWNETINCSSYADQKVFEQINAKLDEKKIPRCRGDREICAKLSAKHASVVRDPRTSILSPLCLNPDSKFSQIEVPWEMTREMWGMVGGLSGLKEVLGVWITSEIGKIPAFYQNKDQKSGTAQ